MKTRKEKKTSNVKKLPICQKKSFNPFMPNVFSHPYQLDEFIFYLMVVGWYFSFLFKFYMQILQASSGEPDQTPLLCGV